MPITQVNGEKLLTVKDVSEILNFSPRQVQRWIAGGLLPAIRFGHAIRVDPKIVDKIKTNGITTDINISLRADCTVSVSTKSRSGEEKKPWD